MPVFASTETTTSSSGGFTYTGTAKSITVRLCW
jgi:hypothetical protein